MRFLISTAIANGSLLKEYQIKVKAKLCLDGMGRFFYGLFSPFAPVWILKRSFTSSHVFLGSSSRKKLTTVSRTFKSKCVFRPVLLLLGLGGVIYAIDKIWYSSVLMRSARALTVTLWIAYEYSTNRTNKKKYAKVDDLHEVAAQRLLNMLMENKGLYIKLGQAIANQGDLFPLAFQRRFAKFYDDAPAEPWQKVDKVLREELGSDYAERYFDCIDKEPVGSASIAQVHQAKLKENNSKVALKVQHSYIKDQVVTDLYVQSIISWIYERVFGIPLSHFSKFITQNLIQEANFLNEVENPLKLKTLIEKDASSHSLNIYIPVSYSGLCRKRVLVTEWCDGIPVNETQRLKEQKLDLSFLVYQCVATFAKQMFHYGFVHSDPHPGNLLARFDNRGMQQLVLLDHGLYTTLSDQLRFEYCHLWDYLFRYDTVGLEDLRKKWGIESMELFSALAIFRPKQMQRHDFKKKVDIMDILTNFITDKNKFPNELLFLTRTIRMIQNLNRSFGSPVNRIDIFTKELLKATSIEVSNFSIFSRERISFFLKGMHFRLMLFINELFFYIIRIRQFFTNKKYAASMGMEDYLDQYIKESARAVGLYSD